MELWIENSAKQLFQNARPGKGSSGSITLRTPKNAYISAQIMLRDLAPFEIRSVRVLNKAKGEKAGNVRIFYQEYRRFNDNAAYPDELTELTEDIGPREVPAHAAQGIWVDFFVPPEAAAVCTEYTVTVGTGGGEYAAEIALDVADVTLPPCDRGTFGHEYFFNLSDIPDFAPGELFGGRWWEALEKTAHIFREMRNNAVLVPVLQLLRAAGSRRTGKDTWEYKWDIFDRFTDVFINAGCAKAFTIGAFTESVNGRSLEAIGYGSESVRIDVPSDEGALFLTSLYTALSGHIDSRGLTGRFRTHIEDEPHTDGTWKWEREIIRRAAPGIPCGEPLDMLETAKLLAESADWFVPRLDVYAQDPGYFRDRRENGKELWAYSCCFPENGWWLNKFIDMPFMRSRMMTWACKANGIDGFLHWGFNYWNSSPLYGTGPDARFKGDGNIVYPDKERRSLKLSARFINTRDGNQDAELIAICARKKPDETAEILRSVCTDFENYTSDSDALCRAAERLLELAAL